MNHHPPRPYGLAVQRLTDDQVGTVLEEVLVHGRRCRLLDTGTGGVPGVRGRPQWLLAELVDGRLTGACPGERWRRSDQPPTADLSAPSPLPERWRILEILVFGPHAQIRIGEGAEAGWISADAPGTLPPWSRPRDRSFLLQGWNGPEHSRTLDGPIPLSVTGEPSGAQAVLPVEWVDFSGRPRPRPEGGTALESSGTWLTVREYWADDPDTGAVGVVFHRLTGVHTGVKPTGPEFDVGTGDEIRREER